jgi:hypothetical protein
MGTGHKRIPKAAPCWLIDRSEQHSGLRAMSFVGLPPPTAMTV